MSVLISTITLSLVTLLTTPLIRVLFWCLNFETIFSRSASLTFCIITCRAACASILPNSTLFTSWVNASPILKFDSSGDLWDSIWKSGLVLSSTVHVLSVLYVPLSLSIWTLSSASSWKCLWDADAIAVSIALKIMESSNPFSVETLSTTAKISLLSILAP